MLSPYHPILVTGGSSGIGYSCAQQLAASSESAVWIASRDAARTREAAGRMNSEIGRDVVVPWELDLGSFASIARFAHQVRAQLIDSGQSLRALVCNAGVQVTGPLAYTDDGFERMFGTNHLGHFLLTRLLVPALAPGARIVVVSSGTHDPATVDGRFNAPLFTTPEELAWPEARSGPRMIPIRRYATSKLCNLYFAYELDRRLRRGEFGDALRGVTVNAYDPGATPGTGLVREYPAWVQKVWTSRVTRRVLGAAGLRVYAVERTAAAMARLVTDPVLAGHSGHYFHVETDTPSSIKSRDLRKAQLLWEASERMTAGYAAG